MRARRFKTAETTYAAPGDINYAPHNGQSLCTGFGSNDSGSGVYGQNLQLFDPRNLWAISLPNASWLESAPLRTPVRAPGGGLNPYPLNIGPASGSTAEVAFANLMSVLLRWRMQTSCVGRGTAAMSEIEPDGTQNDFAASLYEGRAFAPVSPANPSGGNLARQAGFSAWAYACGILTHTETDATNLAALGQTDTSAYMAGVTSMQAQWQAQLGPMGVPTWPWYPGQPLLISLASGTPSAFQGRSLLSYALINLCKSSPALFIAACAKYPFLQNPPLHLLDYRPYGEVLVRAKKRWVKEHIDAYRQGRPVNPAAWAPLWETSVVLSGTTVTITVNNPDGSPLVFDTVTVPQPHQSGALTYWAGGFGFEVWERQVGIVGATNATPIEVSTSATHNFTTGQPVIIDGVCTPGYPVESLQGCNGAHFLNVTGASTFTLFQDAGLTTPVAGTGAYAGPNVGLAVVPIEILSATVLSPTSIQLNLARAPAAGQGYVAYAEHTDAPPSMLNGAVPQRVGNLRNGSGPALFAQSLIRNSLLPGDLAPAMWADWMLPFLVGPL